MASPRTVELRVVEQGAVRVNAAYVRREAPGIACISIAMGSKRTHVMEVAYSKFGCPALHLAAGDRALFLDESMPRDSLTIVDLPEYDGWDVFAYDATAGYTIRVVLLAPTPEPRQQENEDG